MNSLNIITSRVSPPLLASEPRFNGINSAVKDIDRDSLPQEPSAEKSKDDGSTDSAVDAKHDVDDKKPLASEDTALPAAERCGDNVRARWWHVVPQRLTSGIFFSILWLLATLASPGVYMITCLYDDEGRFAPLLQLRKLFGVRDNRFSGSAAAASAQPLSMSDSSGARRLYGGITPRPNPSSSSSGSSTSGASDSDEADESEVGKSKHERSSSLNRSEESDMGQRSIRINLQHDEALGQRKHRRAQSAVAGTKASEEDLSAQLKSPISPMTALTRYPKTPAPPRPLIPRRQPSYLNLEISLKQAKTLILDLDETLIHSMSKGGRMSTGHMVEVRLDTTSLGMSGSSSSAAQHPILYWVNKRPYCDEFLRRVCKWFNLVIFTASVQEYADPVIDWLETERKFFSARYYRQHCTFRRGAYIKDLSSVEPDLSKVMILDNSPLSYLFHQDNAIPIQGWINDPTDNDLMHLIPLLEGLQYVHDIRALLALRGGDDGQHIA